MAKSRLSGVHLKHCKNTADMVPVRMPIPSIVTIPMSMHIGAPAVPVVKVGETVAVGQLIGAAGNGLSSPVYSGVSGKVKKIEDTVASSGNTVQMIVIETDGLQTVAETVVPPTVTCLENFLAAIRQSGIVGLGGAGFPTHVKLDVELGRIDCLVVNGAECEPYITSDTRTMIDDAELVAEGISLVMKYLEIPTAVIGIEKNKPKCISSMKSATKDLQGVRVKSLPSIYPQGGEKVLVYHTLKRVIREGQLPMDQGVIVMNCTTLACLARFIRTGMPLVEKCVTVDGNAVESPMNVIVPIGTRAVDLIEFCGGYTKPAKKILSGGPMMGVALADEEIPVLKQTNALLVFDEKSARPPKETACIKCGKCMDACPFNLSPEEISRAYDLGDGKKLEMLKANLCMECGCCSYVCPAKRNLAQRNKLAKNMLRTYQAKKKEGEGK